MTANGGEALAIALLRDPKDRSDRVPQEILADAASLHTAIHAQARQDDGGYLDRSAMTIPAGKRGAARYAAVRQRIVAEDFSRLVGKNDDQRVLFLMTLEGVVP